MTGKEIQKLLNDVNLARKKHLFADALAYLHEVVNACPDNLTYKYLLASTYFEANREDRAEKYALEILAIEPNSKEALELMGLVAVKNKKYDDAQKYYLKALAIDPMFHNARFNLIELYDEYLHNDAKVEENCRFMLQNRDLNRYDATPREKLKIGDWYYPVVSKLIYSLARQHKFLEAIDYTREYIKFFADTQKRYRPGSNINDYADIYQFYCRIGDEEAIEAFKKELRELIPDFPYFDNLFKDHAQLAFERYP